MPRLVNELDGIVPFADGADIMEKYDSFIFDMDGVLWHGFEFMDYVKPTLDALIKANKQVFFCTNNSLTHRPVYQHYLQKADIDVPLSSVYTAASTTATYVRRYFEEQGVLGQKKAFIIAEDGLFKEFADQGIPTINAHEVAESIPDLTQLKNYALDPSVGAVVVGFDRHLSYTKIALASMYITELDVPFIASNPDTTFIAPPARAMPEVGFTTNGISAVTGRDCVYVGKPSNFMMKDIAREHKLDLNRTLMVGDRLDTDVLFGNSANVDTCLVFSGCTTVDHFLSLFNIPEFQHTHQRAKLPHHHGNRAGQPNPTYCAKNISWLVRSVAERAEEQQAFVQEQRDAINAKQD